MREPARVFPAAFAPATRHRRWLCVVAVLLSGPLHAGDDNPLLACRFAQPPVVPSGATADAATMESAAGHVRQFVTDMQGSLDCLNGLDADSDTAAQLRLLHDNGVDQMHAIAKAFNRELAIFRSRQDDSIHPDQVRELQNLTHH